MSDYLPLSIGVHRFDWRRIGLIAALGTMLIFGGVHFSQTPMWEASGIIRIGQVPHGESLESDLLMSIEMSAEYVRHSVWGEVGKSVAITDKSTFKLRPLSKDMLDLKVRASSPQRAGEMYEGILGLLKVNHDKTFNERQGVLMKENARLVGEIERIRGRLEQQQAICTNYGTKAIEAHLLCLNWVASESVRMDRLSSWQARIQETLQSNRTYPTNTLVGPVISDAPVSPNMALSVALGILGGGSASVLYCVVCMVRRRFREPA